MMQWEGQLEIESAETNGPPLRIDLSSEGELLVIQANRLPRGRRFRSLTRLLWRNRRRLSDAFSMLSQPVRFRVGDRNIVDLIAAPSRLGAALGLPRWTLKFGPRRKSR